MKVCVFITIQLKQKITGFNSGTIILFLEHEEALDMMLGNSLRKIFKVNIFHTS